MLRGRLALTITTVFTDVSIGGKSTEQELPGIAGRLKNIMAEDGKQTLIYNLNAEPGTLSIVNLSREANSSWYF